MIDLTACPGRAQGGTLVEAARTGKPPEVAAPFAGIPVSPSIPPVAAVQNTALLPPAPASGGWKAAACIAFVLLGIFAVVFPVVKISDARKIEAHTERTEKLFSILQRSLQSRIAVAEAVDVSIPPPPSDRELLAKIKEFVDKLPEKVEKQLREILPPEESNDFCHRLVLHGRAICTARQAKCGMCPLASVCDYAAKNA